MEDKTRTLNIFYGDEVPISWEVGQIIEGLYEVKDVKRGGMGEVYFIKHLKWEIPLVVKTLLPEIAWNEEAKKRFIREAETWIALGTHSRIATCFFVKELGKIPRIFIEYVEGGSLKEWIKEKRDLEEILDKAIQICKGMEYVHRKGIIHRDLKPANCLITKEGDVKITDFGIAKIGDDIEIIRGIDLRSEIEGTLTITEKSIGTPEYMPPEQFEDARNVDKRADIYSFGVMLYEMVCGRKPFIFPENMNPIARGNYFKKIHTEEEPQKPIQINGNCPQELNNLILKCLEKKPDKRISSFEEIEEEIAKIYKEKTKDGYKREEEKIKAEADGLNNKGVSLIELGHIKEGIICFEEALELNPVHFASTLNLEYYKMKNKKEDLRIFLNRLRGRKEIYKDDKEFWFNIALIEAEFGSPYYAKESSKKAIELGKNEEKLKEILNIKTSIFEGHTGSVECVAITQDGKHFISGSYNGTLRLWDIESGKTIQIFEGHTYPVICVAITPDGKHFISGSRDETLRLWDIGSGKTIQIFEGHTHWVKCVAITPDGKHFISGSDDKTLRLWDIESGKTIQIFEGHTDYVECVAITPDGKHFISGSRDKTLRLWDIESGKTIQIFKGHISYVSCVAITPDGKHFISGSDDGTLRLWDIESGKTIQIFKGHTDSVECVAITPDGKHFISGSLDETLRLWDIESGKTIQIFEGHTDYVNCVAITPDGMHFISGSDDGTLRLWDIKKRKFFEPILSFPLKYEELKKREKEKDIIIEEAEELIKNGKYKEAYNFLKKTREKEEYKSDIEIIDLMNKLGLKSGKRKGLRTFWLSKIFEGHTSGVSCVAITPDGKHFISGNWGPLRLWDIESGKIEKVFEGHTDSVSCVAITPDGKHFISGSCDETLRLWDIESGKTIQIFKGHTFWVNCVAITPDGKHFISGSWDNTLRLWDIESGKTEKIFGAHTFGVRCVAITPDGKHFISGSRDGTLRLWDIESRNTEKVFKGHTDEVACVAITPDGKHFISGSLDKTLRLWDIGSGKTIQIFEGHTDSVSCVAITPDGKHFISGNWGPLRLWDIESGKTIQIFEGHTGFVYCVAITPDGMYGISGSSDKNLILWELDWDWEIYDKEEDIIPTKTYL